MDDIIIGLPNKVLAELSAKLFSNEYLIKMLYHTEEDSKTENILNMPKLSPSKVIDKNMFVGRRVPVPMIKSGAYLYTRLYGYEPTTNDKKRITDVIININLIVHNDCQKTIHGVRDVCLVELIHQSLRGEFLNGIKEVELIHTRETLGLDPNYSGYEVRIKIVGYTDSPLSELAKEML